mgnify:CR=1 FL=1
MFFFRKLFGLFFVGLLIFGLWGLFGRAAAGRYQNAYQQGFVAGQQAAASSKEGVAAGAAEAAPAAPDGHQGTQVYYRGHSFFFPGFGLLFCLIPLFFLGLMFMGFGKRRWHKHGYRGGPWRHGPCGPGPRRYEAERADSPKEKSPDDIDDGPDEPVMRA